MDRDANAVPDVLDRSDSCFSTRFISFSADRPGLALIKTLYLWYFDGLTQATAQVAVSLLSFTKLAWNVHHAV